MHALRKTIIVLFASLILLTGLSAVSAFAQEEATTVEAAPPVDNSPKGLLAQLPNAGFSEKGEIADKLAASGHPRAALILKALVEGYLFQTSDGAIVMGTAEGGPYSDPVSGATVANVDEAMLDKITVNNRLRRELKGLVARLSLSSSDYTLRRDAAEEAFTARDPESLPVIEAALAKEQDGGIKSTLQQARAAILLGDASADDKTKLGAVATLRDRGDQDALNVLLSAKEGSSPAVMKSADEASNHIRDVIAVWSAAQNVYYGLSLGSVLLLAAIGLAITFGVMGVINMAHGEMIMIGSYTTFVVQQLIASYAPQLFEISLLISIPAAFLVAGAFGILIERSIIRFLYGRPLETLLATFGLSLILQQAVRTIFGPTNREVTAPSWMSGSFEIGLLNITYSRLWILIFSMVVLALLMAFLKRTHFGMQMRAVTQNRQMAAAVGIRTDWVDALTFGLGSGIAGIAGVALSQIDNVSPNLGQSYIIDSFMVVVFGGVGNLWGTLVGAMTLGVANKFLEPYAGAVLGKILVLIFIILFIQKRPRGLFALKGRAVES